MGIVKNVLLDIVALFGIIILLVILLLMEIFFTIQGWCLTNLNKKGQNRKDG